MPNIREREFDEAFAGLIARLHIDMVFATHDSVLEYLASKAGEMNFYLVNGEPRTGTIARRKSATYSLFSEYPWVARVFRSTEDVQEWPIIVKPDMGQGGQQVVLAHDPAEAARAATTMAEPMLVEYLPGAEITVDCFPRLCRGSARCDDDGGANTR